MIKEMTGSSKQMCMQMGVSTQEERRNFTSGLTQPHSTISTPSSGTTITQCKKKKIKNGYGLDRLIDFDYPILKVP